MRPVLVAAFLAVVLPQLAYSSRTIRFANRCGKDVWIAPLTNAQGPTLQPGIVKLSNGGEYSYSIPDGGWAGRFWPKMGCDGSGNSCQVGQSVPPCPREGCQPPAETKVEFFFPQKGDGKEVWYDISLVDGYSVAAEIIPSRTGGTCTRTNCRVSLDSCPTQERGNMGSLKVNQNGKTAMCLAPCKKWNYPAPYGFGRDEQQGDGKWYCCPTPPVSPGECRANIVTQTEYVKLIHRDCPTAYAYSYDDEAGLHNCPNDVSFQVNLC